MQAVGNIYTRLNGSLLTFVRLNVILGGPCGMGAICAVNGDRVVFCLVNDIDLLVITQEHLTAVMNIFSCIRFGRQTHLLRTDTSIANAFKTQRCRSL